MNWIAMKNGMAGGITAFQPLSLRLNFSWNLAGNIIYAACQWGILIVLTKLTSIEMVGRFALGLAITAPVILFSQMGLRGAQTTDSRDEYHFGHYLTFRIGATTIALLILAGIAFFGEYAWETKLLILLVGASKAVESLADVYYGLMQRHERMDRIARSMIIKGVLSLAGVGMAVYITRDVIWGVVAMLILWSAVLIFYDIRNASAILDQYPTRTQPCDANPLSIWPALNFRMLKKLLWLVLPLGFIQALISLRGNIPSYFIEDHWGSATLGIFASLSYLIIVGNTFVGAMSQACVPRLSKYYAHGKRTQFRKMTYTLMAIASCIGICGILVAVVAGKPFLSFIYQPEYGKYGSLFCLIMTISSISYVASVLGYALTATRKFHLFLLPHIILTGATYLASILLIPKYGLMGAVWTGAFTQVCTCVAMIVLLIKTN